MTIDQALQIIPITHIDELKPTYRALVKQHHSDNGGDDRYLAQITSAYRYIIANKGLIGVDRASKVLYNKPYIPKPPHKVNNQVRRRADISYEELKAKGKGNDKPIDYDTIGLKVEVHYIDNTSQEYDVMLKKKQTVGYVVNIKVPKQHTRIGLMGSEITTSSSVIRLNDDNLGIVIVNIVID